MFLSEGLHEDDLDGVVIPVMSIDEYFGKIDDNSIVVSFFLSDPNAALDLSSFIESGPFELLDSDVSKSINEDGYYQVFVEMDRTDEFYKNLKDIVDALSSLTDIKNWSFMSPRTKGESIEFTPNNVKDKVFVSQTSSAPTGTDQEQSMEEALLDHLSHSDATNVKLYDKTIVIEGRNGSCNNEFVTFSDTSLLYHILSLNSKSPNHKLTESIHKLENALGPNWSVESAGQFILLSEKSSPSKTILLK